jgi:hypothetical protein
LPLAAVVVDEADAAGVVDVDVDPHGTVVALPAACATLLASVPPPEGPRYAETRAPHEVTTRDNTRTPSSPADFLFTSIAPRAQASTLVTQIGRQPFGSTQVPVSPGPIPTSRPAP